jgi:hypothetical protein
MVKSNLIGQKFRDLYVLKLIIISVFFLEKARKKILTIRELKLKDYERGF